MEFYNTFEPRSAHRTVLKRCSQWVEEEQGQTQLYACVFGCPGLHLPSSDPFRNRKILPHGALRASFIGGAKLAVEASRFARGSSGNLADSLLVKGDAPRSARPACSGRGSVAHRLSCLSSHLSLLRAGEVRHGKCHDGPPWESSNSQRWSVCLVVDH